MKSNLDQSRQVGDSWVIASPKKYILSDEQQTLLTAAATKISDKQLKDLVGNYGIGLHHAGLSDEDKTIVVDLFVMEQLRIISKFKIILVYLLTKNFTGFEDLE